MPTPEPARKADRPPLPAFIYGRCPICGLDDLVLYPTAVTLNVPAGTFQSRCGPCGEVRTVPAGRAERIVLLAAGCPHVPQGDGARLEATVMAARVFGNDRVPTWPAGGAA